jgi:hypothetical protein
MERWKLEFDVPVNGRVRKARVTVLDRKDDSVKTTDKVDLESADERTKLCKRLVKRLALSESDARQLEDAVEKGWSRKVHERRQQEQAEAVASASPPTETTEILDAPASEIRRPLCLVDGLAYAAAWVELQTTATQSRDAQTGQLVNLANPQKNRSMELFIVRQDGQVFTDAGVQMPGVRPLAELEATVRLATRPPPGRCWSGAGVKSYLAGNRPDPADVFRRAKSVVDRFMDFDRSIADQEVMCELIATYAISTYLLDAFSVIGYLWPSGGPGSGKTNLLIVTTEMAYLGQVILSGGSYATLRDLADYGATLAFDDAENIMDVKRTDPDKRTLLLAGNRRGACVTVKELVKDEWQTRFVDAFCPRLFSAIRLPDPVLSSRTILTPLVRSGDKDRAKVDPLDYSVWPCDHRQLRDDLWALGLAHLSTLREYDRRAAEESRLVGRDLEPWRAILAVGLWLQECHGVDGLHDRLQKLSLDYQKERSEVETDDATRVAIRALNQLVRDRQGAEIYFAPKELSVLMNQIARDEDLGGGDQDLTNPRKVGWLLKRLRLPKESHVAKSQRRKITRAMAKKLAIAYSVDVPDENTVTF